MTIVISLNVFVVFKIYASVTLIKCRYMLKLHCGACCCVQIACLTKSSVSSKFIYMAPRTDIMKCFTIKEKKPTSTDQMTSDSYWWWWAAAFWTTCKQGESLKRQLKRKLQYSRQEETNPWIISSILAKDTMGCSSACKSGAKQTIYKPFKTLSLAHRNT